ncbi:kinase-like domain-containing protein, partial [Immersiella caudata]
MEPPTPLPALSATKLRALDDASETQDAIARQCVAANIPIPPYRLTELIGKGSFGRVYKAIPLSLPSPGPPSEPDLEPDPDPDRTPRPPQHHSSSHSAPKTVAIKIISIEECDLSAPSSSDTFSSLLAEISTLKLLRNAGAQNINTVLDALLVGHTMWLITEYCAGGSVATLMRPAGCLSEDYMIPILREVARGLVWVHKMGVVHRDIKCANVLVTEKGEVQICDFGVAGVVRGRPGEKRSTVTGTLQWMAPEMFDERVSYGREVDVWAFGSMAFEAATGLPPNAAGGMEGIEEGGFGEWLRRNRPRLEGEEHSEGLKGLVGACMVPEPGGRLSAGEILGCGYLRGTEGTHPTGMLRGLVRGYRRWEMEGGDRRSLFAPGGAQRVDESCKGMIDDEGGDGWDYGNVEEADQMRYDEAMEDVDAVPRQVVRPRRGRRRRMPPVDLRVRVVKPPLEKAFDPNTVSNYRDHARVFYG